MIPNNTKRIVQALALAFTACVGAVTAQAQTWYRVDYALEQFNLTIDGNNFNNQGAGDIRLTGFVGNDPQGVPDGVGRQAPPLNGTLLGAGTVIHTLCTDLLGDLHAGYAYEMNTVNFSGQTGINPTWGATPADAAIAIQNASYLYDNLKTSLLVGGTAQDQAALQLAVWAALYDSSSTTPVANWGTVLANGSGARFTINGAASSDPGAVVEAINILNAYLGGANSPIDYKGYLLKPTDPSAQELLYCPTPVPEPTTVLAGMLLLLPFGASTIRHIRRNKAASVA